MLQPPADQVVHHGRVRERRSVAQVLELVRGYLPEYPPHYLAATGLGQRGRELELVRRGYRAYHGADVADEYLLELVGGLEPFLERDVDVDALALDVVREADDRG